MKNLLLISLLFFSNYGFAQWMDTGLKQLGLNAMSGLNTDTFILASDGRMFKTYNRGVSFDSMPTPAGLGKFTTYKSADTIIAINPFARPRYFYSTNGGNTWQGKHLILTNGDTAFKKGFPVFMGFFNQSHGIILGDTVNDVHQIFLTADGGNTWQHFNPPVNYRINTINTQSNKFYINNDGIFKTLLNNRVLLTISNYGKQWVTDTIGDSSKYFTKTIFKDANNGIGIVIYTNGFKHAKTNDGGKTWQTIIDTTKTSVQAYAKPTKQTAGFYIGHLINENAYISFNDGNSWQLLDSIKQQRYFLFNDAESGVMTVSVSMTDKRMYYFTNKLVGLKEQANKKPTQSSFAYPNPASQQINFTQAFKQITLIDALGKTTLQSTQTMQLNITHLPNGLYWLIATDEKGNAYTQKLVIGN